MPTASFPLKEVVALAEVAKKEAAERGTTPAMDQLFDPSLWENGTPLDKDGLSEAECEKAGGFFWPDASKMTKPAPVGLLLVGDSGLYLLGTHKAEKPASESGDIVYARGCNPNTDDDYYESKRAIFGGDDGTIFIPIEWVDVAVKAGKRRFSIKLGKNSVRLA